MAATKLSLFNGAQRLLKNRKLSQAEVTGGTRESARLLNDVWDDGAIDAVLQAGQWKFATRTRMVTASPSIEPDFGYRYAFDKPEDWIRTTGVWVDENMLTPLKTYRDEAGYLFASVDTIYFSYISNDASYGGDLSRWPQNFKKFVHAYLASEVVGPLTERGLEMLKLKDMFLKDASATDAMSDPTARPPAGSWVRARLNGGSRMDGQPQ